MNKIRLHHSIEKNLQIRDSYTRSEIQRNIQKYGVYVDGILTTHRLAWVYDNQAIVLNNWPQREQGDLSKIKIFAEEVGYWVIYKPSGVVVHSGAGHKTHTLFDWIVEHLPGQKELVESAPVDNNAYRSAGLVHRLDKDTAGLIIVAKTLKWHRLLQDEFRNRKVVKKYLAVVDGKLDNTTEIKGWQSRSLKNPRLQKFFENESEALHYSPLARFSHSIIVPISQDSQSTQTLCEIEIKTGRMHQIRLHTSWIAHPVANDPLYNPSPLPLTITTLTEHCPENTLQLLANSITILGKTYQLFTSDTSHEMK